MISLITLFSSYYSCTNHASWLSPLFAVVMFLFTLQSIIILVFSFLQKSKIKQNIDNGKDKFDSINMIDDAKYDSQAYVGGSPKQLLVLPLYIIGVYALSKIIVILVKDSTPIEYNIYLYMLWGAIFTFSTWLWAALKEYAENENRYSIKYTLIIIIITLVSIFWELLTPYIADIIELTKCVINQILVTSKE
ncbi:hypothetical protein KJ870_02615 [bacterium]|nr:hypothetical protein [bacterium]MBU1433813.1 hypothetical protein [bacterium]MBU1503888.1 hypothetical protein [bacterium]